jgi:hypothetical protein
MRKLFADVKLLNDFSISTNVFLHEILEKASALSNKFQQASPTVIVLFVTHEMGRQHIDVRGENCNLNFGTARVSGAFSVFRDNLCLMFFGDWHRGSLEWTSDPVYLFSICAARFPYLSSVFLFECAALSLIEMHLLNELLSTLKLALLSETFQEPERKNPSVEISIEIQEMSLDSALTLSEEGRPDADADHPIHRLVANTNLREIDAVLRGDFPLRETQVRCRISQLATPSVTANDDAAYGVGPAEQPMCAVYSPLQKMLPDLTAAHNFLVNIYGFQRRNGEFELPAEFQQFFDTAFTISAEMMIVPLYHLAHAASLNNITDVEFAGRQA